MNERDTVLDHLIRIELDRDPGAGLSQLHDRAQRRLAALQTMGKANTDWTSAQLEHMRQRYVTAARDEVRAELANSRRRLVKSTADRVRREHPHLTDNQVSREALALATKRSPHLFAGLSAEVDRMALARVAKERPHLHPALEAPRQPAATAPAVKAPPAPLEVMLLAIQGKSKTSMALRIHRAFADADALIDPVSAQELASTLRGQKLSAYRAAFEAGLRAVAPGKRDWDSTVRRGAAALKAARAKTRRKGAA